MPSFSEKEKIDFLLNFIKSFKKSKLSNNEKLACIIEGLEKFITKSEENFFMAFMEEASNEQCGFCKKSADLLFIIREISDSPFSEKNKNKLYLKIAKEGFEKNGGFPRRLGCINDLISTYIKETLEG